MENILYKEGINIVSMNDNDFYKKTRNNVLIISEKIYLSLHNLSYFFRNRLTIVLTKHPNIFLDDKAENYDNNNDYDNDYKTEIIFTNNEKMHNVILNNRENFQKWYPILRKKFKIFIVDDK